MHKVLHRDCVMRHRVPYHRSDAPPPRIPQEGNVCCLAWCQAANPANPSVHGRRHSRGGLVQGPSPDVATIQRGRLGVRLRLPIVYARGLVRRPVRIFHHRINRTAKHRSRVNQKRNLSRPPASRTDERQALQSTKGSSTWRNLD